MVRNTTFTSRGGQVDGDTLVSEVSRHIPNKLDLLFDREPTDNGLQDRADRHPVFTNQTAVINVGEDTHQEPATLSAKNPSARHKIPNALAVHSISHSPVSRDTVTKVLDVKGTLKSGSEEATEGGNERRENGHDEQMKMVGRIWERRNISPKL